MSWRWLGLVSAGLGSVACTGGLSVLGNGPTTVSSISISGTVGGLSAFSAFSAFSDMNVSLASNLCADGNYYRVRCLSWTNSTATESEADVKCGGTNSGSFIVKNLKPNSDITCFVRKSTDGTTYSAFASIELPAASLSGTTDTINSSGNLALSVTVNSNGTISTTVTSGSSTTQKPPSTTTNPTTFNGFYNVTCSGLTDDSQRKSCKCFLFSETVGSYASSPGGSQSGCFADTITNVDTNIPDATTTTIDANVYTATVGSGGLDLNGDGTADLKFGDKLQAISLWKAEDTGAACTAAASCVTARGAGGEGATTLGGSFSWDASSAPFPGNALAWQTGAVSLGDKCGSLGADPCNVNLTTNAVPSNTANRGAWLTWIRAIATTSDYYCDGVAAYNSSTNDDAFCLANFISQVYEKSVHILPKISLEVCRINGVCTGGTSPAPASSEGMIGVDGLEFDGSGNVKTAKSIGATTSKRIVFEQWTPATGGGGSFKQAHDDRRWLICLGATGTDSSSGVFGCGTGASSPMDTATGLECFTREEQAIRFMPARSGTYKIGFKKTSTVKFGRIRGGDSDGDEQGGTGGGLVNATSKCKAIFGTNGGGDFFANATKL